MGKPTAAKGDDGKSTRSFRATLLIIYYIAQDIVMVYLKKQNRPYSATDLFNNLNGAVGKANVQKVLTQMQEEGIPTYF